MKKKISLFLTAILLAGNILMVPVSAEEGQTTESSAPTSATEAPKPTETTAPDPEPTTKPTEGSTGNTTVPTEETQPLPCSHTYSDWSADEGSHWKSCTTCGHKESSGHSWASETITVAPTCKEPGGVCKICTVCQGVLVTQIIPQTAEHTYDSACDEACNVCGAEREVTHSYGTGWTYSYKGHWHKCTVCGTAGELKSHYPGPAATEEKNQICLTCGYVMMKKKEHTHKYASDWSSDDSGHWYVCTGCQEKDSFAAHTYDNVCDTECNDCGYVREAMHEYGVWISDETSHWQVCDLCKAESPRGEHDVNGEGICSICLYHLSEPHEHEYGDEWKSDAYCHWQECGCGEKTDAADHIWNDGTEEEDVIIYTCETCQAEKQEEAPQKSFPLVLLLAGGGILFCLIGIVICLLVMRSKESDYC